MNSDPVNEPTEAPELEALTVDSDDDFLKDLLSDPSSIRSEFRIRNSLNEQRSVHPADAEEYIAKGWTVSRPGKRQTRLVKPKALDRLLEDRAWCLLYRMGFSQLNPKSFRLRFRRSTGSTGAKQVDAFACDSETAIVVECKTRSSRGRRSLQKDLFETQALKDYFRQTIRAHYKGSPVHKILWVYITSNIIWSEPDLERARDFGIYIITENEIRYFEAYLKHMGPAGRYQILGEFFSGQKIPGLAGNRVPAIRGTLGGMKFYSFVTTPRVLLKVAFVNHQALNHPDGRPAYQRMVSSKRLKEIGEFISRRGGFFPTNILINFTTTPKFEPVSNKENESEDTRLGWLTFPPIYRSAWIIDGQHRLYGFSRLDDKYLDHNIPVIAFDQMDAHREADLFITINHKQKSVPSGLLVTLLADLRVGDSDPQVALSALASRLVRRVSTDPSSPFGLRFTQPDLSAGPGQNLTISEVVKGLNRSGLLGRHVGGVTVPGPLAGATDEETVERARRVLNSYFEAIRTANPERWELGKSAYICVNPGIRAQLMLIAEIIAYLTHRKNLDFLAMEDVAVAEEVEAVADPVFRFIREASDEEVQEKFSRKFGEGGVREYLFNLFRLVHSKNSDFGTEDFRRYLQQEASDEIEEAGTTIMKISSMMTDCVIRTLKAVYGEIMQASGDYSYWELGIESRRVKENAFKKQQEDPVERRGKKEAYLDILDLKSIIEQRENWLHFARIFSAQMPSERAGKAKYLSWIERFNEVRRIAAHKSEMRTYSDDDLEFVDWLRSEILPRLESELN